MRIQNYTSTPREKLAEIIRFTCPPGVAGFDIAFKNGRTWRGGAYIRGCSYHTRSMRESKNRQYIVIACEKREEVQGLIYEKREAHGAYIEVTCYTREEILVYLVAHELRHLWQDRVKRGRRVWGSKGVYSERDASTYGLQMLRQWRRR